MWRRKLNEGYLFNVNFKTEINVVFEKKKCLTLSIT